MMQNVLSELFRFVFCPLYFSAIENDWIFERIKYSYIVREANEISTCFMCQEKKESFVILKQIKIGLSHITSNKVKYCANCYHDVEHWDRMKYVKHFVLNDHILIEPFCNRTYISMNDTIETIYESFRMEQEFMDEMYKKNESESYSIFEMNENMKDDFDDVIDEFERLNGNDFDDAGKMMDDGYDSEDFENFRYFAMEERDF